MLCFFLLGYGLEKIEALFSECSEKNTSLRQESLIFLDQKATDDLFLAGIPWHCVRNDLILASDAIMMCQIFSVLFVFSNVAIYSIPWKEKRF